MNVIPFCEKKENIIFLTGSWDLQYKSNFIESCDAMLHARSNGETFGYSVAEFSMKNKPVITYKNSPEKSHIDILKERGIEDVKNPIISFEGVTGEVNPKGPALEGIYNILNNIRSGFTYSGAPNIKEFQNNLEYIEVSSSSARESGSRV